MAVVILDLAGSFTRLGIAWDAAPESKSAVPLTKVGTTATAVGSATGIVCGCGCDDTKQGQWRC